MNMYAPEGMLISTPRNYEYISSPEGLSRALARGAILEAQAVLCDHRMNLHIELGAKIKGIIPREESQYLRADEEIKGLKTYRQSADIKTDLCGSALFLLLRGVS